MIKTDVILPLGYTQQDIVDALCAKLPLKREELTSFRLLKRTLDLNDKTKMCYRADVGVSLSAERERGLLLMRKKVRPCPDLELTLPSSRLTCRPVVVGAGPAGLFCALTLALAGARPILYERGLAVEERKNKVAELTLRGILDPECNVQFGEGGAGTYSDGKLKVGGLDKYKSFILEKLISHGAPEDVAYSTNAHVGTDKLTEVVKGIRKELISLGADVYFESKLVSLKCKNGHLVGGRVEKNGEIIDFETDTLILATGHSAEDTFRLLLDAGASLSPRGFGIGLRIEHPREYIDKLIYGSEAPTEQGAASYHLVTHLANGRSVYSFCMCPGGTVVPATSNIGSVVTNGMSEYSRSAENSNAAFLVSVTPEDFSSEHPLAGISLQRSIESAAYALSSSYRAPVQLMSDFTEGRKSSSHRDIIPSYPAGCIYTSAEEYLPDYICSSLSAAISDFEEWMPGFYSPDCPMTGPETRSTSPVRVLRDGDFSAVGIKGLYPVGEGAGYAGGIISSARDGVMAAEAILMMSRSAIS